ncbi:hypothetical protein B296_00025865 [Ensete ventricosum]|uniref:Uncharacterized protein n=1 Tax=Ensete ventricosum TaxID=4639 RepID=A0A426XAM0_ENSVE|nr:hypothetical protein B296_00025865 [Ensete ventricosum]
MSRAEVSARPVLVRVRKSANVGGGRNSLWIDDPSGVLDGELGRFVPMAVSGMAILHTCLSRGGRGDPERPLRRPIVARDMAETYGGRAVAMAWDRGMGRHAALMGMGQAASCLGPSTSDSRSDADLVPWADVASSKVLSWLSI